jgi:hypothetical protein
MTDKLTFVQFFGTQYEGKLFEKNINIILFTKIKELLL